jgi:hypothetical protein
VAQATNTPSNNPSFAPVTVDGASAAATDTNAGTRAAATTAPNPDLPPANRGSSELASPASTTHAEPLAPDNSRVNARDKSGKNPTPMDQGGSEGDRKITQRIRQAIVENGNLSFAAKNVKIITIDGKVTLRGPVKSAAERASVEAAAKEVAGAGQVNSQLEVKN